MWFFDSVYQAVWPWVPRAVTYVITAVAEFELPYSVLNGQDRFELIISMTYLYSALVCLFMAWMLARWIYNAGPLRALWLCVSRLQGENRA